MDYELDWKPLPEKRASRIVHYLPNAPLDNEDRWREYRSWMIQVLEDFDRVFRNRIKVLDPDNFEISLEDDVPE